jgi:hypothetical protein
VRTTTFSAGAAASIRTAVAIAALAGAGCNAKDPSQPKPPTPQAESGVIPQAQLDALNKARGVGDVLQQGAQRSDPEPR